MTRAEAVALIGLRLGQRTDLDAAIGTELLLVQQVTLERAGAFLPWFLETAYTTLATVVGATSISLPADFLGEIEDKPPALYVVSGTEQTWTDLHKGDMNDMLYRAKEAGEPHEYCVTSTALEIFPRSDAVYAIKFAYYASDTIVAGENKWLKHAPDLLIAETGYVMALNYMQNKALADTFKEAIIVAKNRLWLKHEELQHTNRHYTRGEG